MTRTRNLILGFALLSVVAFAIILIPKWCETFPFTCTPKLNPVYVYGGYRCFEDEQCLAVLRDKYQSRCERGISQGHICNDG